MLLLISHINIQNVRKRDYRENRERKNKPLNSDYIIFIIFWNYKNSNFLK
jgi:hypothetical protein